MKDRHTEPTVTWPALLQAELPVVALMAGIAAVYAVFRLLVDAGLPQRPGELVSLDKVARLLWSDFVQHFVGALLMWAVVQPVRYRGPQAGLRRVAAVAGAALAGAALAAAVRAVWFIGLDQLSAFPQAFVQVFTRFSLLAGMVVTVGEFHRAEILSLEAMRAAEASRAALAQQTLQARLKVLEAQIEPHFLFNTLANVRRLYQNDAIAGESMLERLMRYLEIALPSMRSDRVTLDREASLIAAYLDLQRVRMGRRLAYRVDIEPSLRGIEVPPMMLLTLVENAIKHGLAPRREGGRVDVCARARGGELCLEVSDTGEGFGKLTSGGGTGLANIRARLAAMFGSAARLTLVAQAPHGVVASIHLPLAARPA